MKSTKPELVGTYQTLQEYDQAKALLQHAGLHPSSDNEMSVQLIPYMSRALGGVRLLVLPEEAEHAREILARSQMHFVEINYAHRVRRSVFAACLALTTGVTIGVLEVVRTNSLGSGIAIGVFAAFMSFLILGLILIPKAELKQE